MIRPAFYSRTFRGLALPAAVAVLAALAHDSSAQISTTFTQALSNNWYTPGNWDAGVPMSGYAAFISSGRTAVISGGNVSLYDINIASDGQSGTVQVTGGATITHNSEGQLAVGYSGAGTGTLSIDSGSVSTTYLQIGYGTGSRGIVTLTGSGSSITSNGNNTNVGYGENSQGTLSLALGAHGSSYGLYVGSGNASTGSFTLASGSSWTTTSQFHVGSFGSGTALVTGAGTHLETTTDQGLSQNYNYIGYFGNGTMTVSDSATWHTVGYVGVGGQTTVGSLTISTGAAVTVESTFDAGAGGDGAVVVTDVGTSLAVGQARIGGTENFGTGSLAVRSGATLTSDADIYISDNGTLTIGGSGLTAGTVTAPSLSFNAATSAIVFNHSDDIAFLIPITSFDVGYGTLTKTGAGILTLSNASAFTGATTISGGTLRLGTADALNGSAVTLAGGTLDLNGFSATLGGLVGSSDFNFGAGTLTIGGSGSSTYSGILGGGALVKSGSGTFKLTGTNTYIGGTTITGGLVEFSSAANFGAGSVTLNGGGLRWAAGNTLDITAPGQPFVLTGNVTSFDTNANDVTLAGATSALTGLRKLGAGTLTLSSPSTYTGPTTISGGTLALAGPLPTGNLTLNGGVLAQSGTITRGFGTGTGQFVLSGNTGGGFAAVGGPLTVTPGTATWGTTGFFASATGALILGSTTADNVVTWSSNISLANAARTITVNDNPASNADYARISGVISSSGASGALTKNGAGALVLTAANTYLGATSISGGTLALSGSGTIPTTRLNLSGGVLAMTGTFSRALGTGANQFSLSGNVGGGFAAYGGPLTVSPSGTLTWGGTNFFASNATGALILGSSLADNVVTWTSNIALGSGARTITVNDNPASNADSAAISGILSGTGSITKNGPGLLVLGNANTYTGPTTISGGTLKVNGSLAAGSAVTVSAGGTLGGSGTVAGTVAVSGTISPGNSPGTLSTGAETWNGGGSYVWEINQADGTKGADPGYDFLSITGGLNVAATGVGDGNKFTIYITSLTLGNAAGLATGFVPGQTYTFTIATSSTGVTNFNAGKFLINTSAFFNDPGNLGGFAVVLSGDNKSINLTYTAVPEPSTWAFGTAGLLGVVVFLRRRQNFLRE